VDPVPPPTTGAITYVAQTGHTLSGPLRDFWSRYGGDAIVGQPQTEAFREGGRLVQFTDHFLIQLSGGQVSAAPLGRLQTAQRRFVRGPVVRSARGHRYFPTTGQSLSGLFLNFWQGHQGAILLGAPISPVLVEGNGDGSGRRYHVQWFENGRLEDHPELAGTPYRVELGLVGVQALQARGWLAAP
jgi:hypothetical protein